MDEQKKFTGVSGECYVVQNDTTVFAVQPKFTLPEENEFAKVFGKDSKIQFSLYNHKNGKGEDGIYAKFNMDLDVIEMLKWDVRFNHQSGGPFYQTKIIGAQPVNGGQFHGLCPTFKFALTLRALDNNNQPMRYPWTITISNGYAEAAKGKHAGSYYEKSGTYRKLKEVSMSFTRQTLNDVFEKIEDYKHMFLNLEESKDNFKKGWLRYQDTLNDRMAQYKAPKAQEENTSVAATQAKAEPTQPAPVQTEPATVPAAEAVAVTQESESVSVAQEVAIEDGRPAKTTPFFVEFLDDQFTTLETDVMAVCQVYGEGVVETGKELPIYFDCVPNEVLDAQRDKKRIELLLYPDGAKIRCFGLAS